VLNLWKPSNETSLTSPESSLHKAHPSHKTLIIPTIMKPIAFIRASGSHLPPRVVDNHELSQSLDTSHEWIVRRTGIVKRHIAENHDTTSGLATIAAQKALDNAKISAHDIDLVVLATSSPDHGFPATAARVQAELGISKGTAFDVQAACAGFIFALQAANNMIRLGQASRALVIGSEIFSRLVDWQDRSTCILFGDGAGAVVLDSEYVEDTSFPSLKRGIVECTTRVDGTGYHKLFARSGLGDLHANSDIHKHGVFMNGASIFKAASSLMAEGVSSLINKHQIHIQDIDILIPHQANLRIITSMASSVGIPEKNIVVTVDKHANTSAASIPLAIDHAFNQKQLKKGQNVIITALGGGIAWGSALIKT
jgi:3-oxoacyl-[acyl-carrier-protein] synthase-3